MIATRSVRIRRRGATLVEFALVAPVFFLFVAGLIEFGRTFMVMEMLTEAARLGCRQAAIEGSSSDAIQSTAANFLNNGGVNGATASVYLNGDPAGSTNLSTVPAFTEITVVVTVPVANVAWTPSLIVTGSLSGQYTLRRE